MMGNVEGPPTILADIIANKPLAATEANYGVSGTTTWEIRAEVNGVLPGLSIPGQYVVLEGGINDIRIGTGGGTFIDNWTNMINTVKTKGALPVLLLIAPATVLTTVQAQLADTYNEQLVALAAALGGVIVADPRTYIGQFRVGGDLGNLWDLQVAYDHGDGLHWNHAGNVEVSQCVIDVLP